MIEGFAPVVSSESKILVLGSMPSVASLQAGQYYAHPRNAFWPIMGALAGVEAFADYAQKLETLDQLHVGLWDVVHACTRNGSLDSSIRDAIPNDIPGLLEEYRSIDMICCNGTAARDILGKRIPNLPKRVAVVCLPSTSPANTIPFSQKLSAYQQVLLPL